MNLSADHLRRRVEQLWQPEADERIIGFEAKGSWDGPDTLEAQGQSVPIRYCRSPLEVAEQLIEIDGPIVILTPISERELPGDVLARMTKQRLQRIDRTELIQDAYGVNSLDPRIPKADAMIDALVRSAPAGTAERQKNVLSLDDAWQAVLRVYLGLDAAPVTLDAVLEWSTEPEASARYAALPEDLQAMVQGHMQERLGGVGAPIVSALKEGHADLLLPIGLVSEVLAIPESGGGRALQTQAITRLERYLSGVMLTVEQADAWYRSAKSVLAALDLDAARDACQRAESLIENLKAQPLAILSSTLPSGFAARKRRVAQALSAWDEGTAAASAIREANDYLRQHRLARDEKYAPVCDRLQMAQRLVDFIESSRPSPPSSLAQACSLHGREHAFVDWARRLLAGGDDDALVAKALDQLCERVFELREAFNRQFAEKLADALETDSFHGQVLPIERFLDCLASTAADQPILLLVLDGLDCSAFEELAEDLRDRGWSRWQRPEFDTLLSVLPSVTELSRKALLTGNLKAGASAVEKREFENHSKLRVGATNTPGPRLFHKAEIEDAATEGLSSSVREAIRETARRIVAVVLNAVDDHLDKTDQLRLNWTVEQFRHLNALLNEARQAGCVVIITSDHGHVLESSSTAIATGSKGRWRGDTDDQLDAAEIRLSGARIEAATGQRSIVALWSERARYGKKATGYHGGVAPQEVVVPYGAFTLGLGDLLGWQPVPEPRPAWWRGQAEEKQAQPPPAPRSPKTKPSGSPQQSLFETADRPDDWISRLLKTKILAEQRALAGRTAPDEETIEKAVRALELRDGRMPIRVLAQVLEQQELRMRGILAGLQRVLNVEGFAALEFEEQSRTIKLNPDLLRQQFDLDA